MKFQLGDSSLKRKISTLIITILLLSAICNVVILIKYSSHVVEETVSNHGIEMAKNIANTLNVDEYEEFLSSKEENDVYWKLREQLNDYRVKSDSLYVYTLEVDPKNQKLSILIDGFPKGSDLAVDIGSPVTGNTFEDVEEAVNGIPTHTSIINDPEFGQYVSAFVPIEKGGKVIGLLGVDTKASIITDIESNLYKKSIPLFSVVSILLVILSITITYILLTRQLLPLKHLSKAAQYLTKGELTESQKVISQIQVKNKDEIAELSSVFKLMVDKMINMIENISHVSNHLARAAQTVDEKTGYYIKVNDQISTMLDEIAVSSNDQLISANHTFVSIDEMTQGIQQIASCNSGVSELSNSTLSYVELGEGEIQKAVKQMVHAQSVVNQSNESMVELQTHSKEIEKIIDVISAISEQTNLLALNASIEAARAGDAGKGFSVVSMEVRKLAEQSKAATLQISSLIQKLQEVTRIATNQMQMGLSEVKKGTEDMHKAGQRFKEIHNHIGELNESFENVSGLTQELAANSEEISLSIREFTKVIESNSIQSEEATSSMLDQVKSMDFIHQSTNTLLELSNSLEANIKQFIITTKYK